MSELYKQFPFLYVETMPDRYCLLSLVAVLRVGYSTDLIIFCNEGKNTVAFFVNERATVFFIGLSVDRLSKFESVSYAHTLGCLNRVILQLNAEDIIVTVLWIGSDYNTSVGPVWLE